MGAFRTDPSIALRGVSRPFDPIAAFSRIANLRRLQQAGQFNQFRLEDAQRERERQQGIRGALAGGGTRADILSRLQQVAPLEAFKLEDQFAKEKREAGQAKAELTETQLKNTLDIYDIIGREAGSLKAAEERDISDEALQIMYANSLARLPRQVAAKLPQKYERGMADEAIAEAVSVSQQIKNALQAAAIEERKRPIPGRGVPFPPKVAAQRMREIEARRAEKPPDPKVKIRAQEAKDRAMTKAVENYSKKIGELEKTWQSVEEPPEEGGRRTWVNRNTGGVISNEEYLAKRREVENQLISAQEQADLSYLEKIETAGFEPGLPVDFRAQARARRRQSPTISEAAAAQTFEEGDILVNHQTGERIVLRGGKWVPAPR